MTNERKYRDEEEGQQLPYGLIELFNLVPHFVQSHSVISIAKTETKLYFLSSIQRSRYFSRLKKYTSLQSIFNSIDLGG